MFIQNLIYKALNTDPNATALLKELSAKSIELKITTLHKSFFLIFIDQKLQILQNGPNTPNATITGPLKAFIKLALSKDPHAAARLGLILEGETHTLQILQSLFKSLDIDWEEFLAPWTGDIVAHQLGRFSRTTQQKKKTLLKSTSQMITEYLQEECRLLPTRIEIDDFLDSVDEIHAAANRLEAKIDQLLPGSV